MQEFVERRVLSLLLEPESQVRCISDALRQQAFTDPVAAEVLQLIPTILVKRFRDKTIPEFCNMGGPDELASWLAATGGCAPGSAQ